MFDDKQYLATSSGWDHINDCYQFMSCVLSRFVDVGCSEQSFSYQRTYFFSASGKFQNLRFSRLSEATLLRVQNLGQTLITS